MPDIIIIGGGVSGCAIARELSRYNADILLLEAEEDVCCGTSKANSAIVHAGFDASPGSLMAKLNVEGSRKMPALAKELDFAYDPCGSLVVCTNEADLPQLDLLLQNGLQNGVEGLRIITDRDELRTLEPGLADTAVAALWAPSAGIVCPFGLTYAFAENAAANGVQFRFNTRVTDLKRGDDGLWAVETEDGCYSARVVINAAGVFADELHNRVCDTPLHITPRRGVYFLLDHAAADTVRHTVFQLPSALGKGVLVTPTVHGNLLIGPTATDIADKEDTATTAAELDELRIKCGLAVKDLPMRQIITSFAGLRAHEDGHEFVICENADGFFDCAGIESPGLSASPAIGCYLADLVKDKLNLEPKADFIASRKGILNPQTLPFEERAALIQAQPAYGKVICRCETVTEGEIIDAIRRTPGARSLDGVKRRTRAGMGRCQAGFCSPRVLEILARELDLPQQQITKSGGASLLILGNDKDSY